MTPLLWRSLLRHLSRHPWQLVLAVLGIALGVAVVLAVDLANASARKSLELSMEQVTGRTSHRISGGPQGVPEALYTRLRVELGFRQSAPVISGYAESATEPGRQFQLLGVDILAEAPFRPYVERYNEGGGDLSTLLTQPYSALFPEELATQDQLSLLLGERPVTLHKAGVIKDVNGLVVTDIATAQVLLRKPGRLSHIDLILAENETGASQAERIRAVLPPGLSLERAAERNQALGELSAAFSLNLTAMSLLALVVGMFLIYNTMSFAVVQRRQLLGMLRALGVSRRQIFTGILGEALLLGLAGTLLGGILGLWLGSGLVHLVTRTIDDLYYTLTVRAFHPAAWSLVKAAMLGLVATMVAAWLPAREAANAPPGSALSRAQLESRWQAALPRLNLTGLLLLALGGLLLWLTATLVAGFAGLFLMILGCALLTPGAVALFTRLLHHVGGLTVSMAARDVARQLSRTGVAAAALMVAFASAVGVGVMVDSFRGGVSLWLSDLLNADIYIAPLEDSDGHAALNPEVLAQLRRMPTVADLSTYRRREVRVGARISLLLVVDLASRAKPGYRLLQGDPATAWPALDKQEAVLISEPLAYHHGLDLGDKLTLRSDQGSRDFLIAGVFHDYGSEHGRVLIHSSTYQRYWQDPAVGSVAIYSRADSELDALQRRLEQHIGHLQPLVMRANRDILERSLAVFERTFTITNVLRLLAVVVAFVGVLSALMALQLERAREFAVLRAIGMTPIEIARLVSLETGFMGLSAGLLAVPVGLLLGAILIFVINRRAFGWTLPFQIEPWLLVQAVILAVLAALLAGIYPLWRMARTAPAQALRAE